MFLLLTDRNGRRVNERERAAFVFVPSRTAEVNRTEGNFEVDPGRGEFLLCLLLNACVASFAKHGIVHGVIRKVNICSLFLLIPLFVVSSAFYYTHGWCLTSSLIFFSFRMANLYK